jgi:hypothetical protein
MLPVVQSSNGTSRSNIATSFKSSSSSSAAKSPWYSLLGNRQTLRARNNGVLYVTIGDNTRGYCVGLTFYGYTALESVVLVWVVIAIMTTR